MALNRFWNWFTASRRRERTFVAKPIDQYLDESISTAADVPVAGVECDDGRVGVTSFAISGADAAVFVLSGRALYLKAGTVLVLDHVYHATLVASNPFHPEGSTASITLTIV